MNAASARGLLSLEDSPDGRLLLIDGIVQSVMDWPDEELRGYWVAMLPSRRPARILLLGLGAGTLVELLRRRFGPLPITGVDDDPRVIEIARERLGEDAQMLTIVEADACAYVKSCQGRYDLILVDLFRGEALPSGALSKDFRRRLRDILEPGGRLVWNLHRDQRGMGLRRALQRTLLTETTVLAGLNLILHLRRRRYHKRRTERGDA